MKASMRDAVGRIAGARGMRTCCVVVLAVIVSTAIPAAAGDPVPDAPLLPLDQAVEPALRQNHLLAGKARAVDETKGREAAHHRGLRLIKRESAAPGRPEPVVTRPA